MRANKKSQSRHKKTTKRPRRAPAKSPTLQMTLSPGHTDWTCPVCRAVGTVQHVTDIGAEEILALARMHHATKQPTCRVHVDA